MTLVPGTVASSGGDSSDVDSTTYSQLSSNSGHGGGEREGVDMAACIYTIYLSRCAQPRPVIADLHAAAAWQGQGPLRGGEARGAAPRPAHQPPPGGGQQRGHQPRIHRQPQQRQPPALRLAQGRNIIYLSSISIYLVYI